jgi:hypothetical protein
MVARYEKTFCDFTTHVSRNVGRRDALVIRHVAEQARSAQEDPSWSSSSTPFAPNICVTCRAP